MERLPDGSTSRRDPLENRPPLPDVGHGPARQRAAVRPPLRSQDTHSREARHPGIHGKYTAALDKLVAAYGPRETPPRRVAPEAKRGTLGWLCAQYFGDEEFKALASAATRRGVIEECLKEPLMPGGTDVIRDVPLDLLSPMHIRMLRDRKRKLGLKGAANNRRKYLSAMFGWAIETDPPLIRTNPARDVKRVSYATDGYHTWTVEEVRQFEARHPVGTKARLAIDLLLFLGVRRGDVVRLGPQHVRGDSVRFVTRKMRHRRAEEVEKPILPVLAEIIAATPVVGTKSFLVTAYGHPFTAKGFGNWFRDRCNEAGLPHCSAHGLRKAGATLAVENGAAIGQLMALFDWSSPAQAEVYIRKFNRTRNARDGAALIAVGYNANTGVPNANTGLPHRPLGDCPTADSSNT